MSDFKGVYAQLRSILLPYAAILDCTADGEEGISIDTRHIQANKQPLYFGGVQIEKNYVSYHLMPIYINPALLESISPALKKRMQGKSCFNFTSADDALFQELAMLTEACFQYYRQQGYV